MRAARPNQFGVKKILVEAALVAVAGSLFALAANQLSPRGLKLTRNYFPGSKPGTMSAALPVKNAISSPPRAATNTAPAVNGPGALANAASNSDTVPSDAQLLAQRLRENGLRLIELPQVRQLAEDPRARQGLIVFIDARNEESYRAGHIPGACEFDPYHPEKYAGTVVPLCEAAQQVVVYCAGGDCEDSEFAAINLRDAGIPSDKLFVYGGGITEWKAKGLAMESGGQNGGKPGEPKP